MPDKRQNSRSSGGQAPLPKQPPKDPPQDYSSLPQKPIKLKADVNLPSALKRDSAKPRPKKRSQPPIAKKKRVRKKSPEKTPPLLNGLSQQARESALAAAEREGVTIEAWLERRILEETAAPPAVVMPDMQPLLDALDEIRQRLERLEGQKGFWQRFWDQYMDPNRR